MVPGTLPSYTATWDSSELAECSICAHVTRFRHLTFVSSSGICMQDFFMIPKVTALPEVA